jgi:hypothetical protein
MATIIKALTIDDNYMVLKNSTSDIVVYDRITTPSWVHEGYCLLLEFDENTRGGGIFIKNGVASGENMKLSCWRVPKKINLTSEVTIDATPGVNKNVIGHIISALEGIRDANNTARNTAIDAANTAYIATGSLALENRPWYKVYSGNFAYGPGGAGFSNAMSGEIIGGIEYFDYYQLRTFVTLLWNGTHWEQRGLELMGQS